VGTTVAEGVQPVRRRWLRDVWQKYGLIVVGNLVFFALLYFVQYRPNSRDNRASELLTMAQREEAEQRLEAAETLYAKVLVDYEGSSAYAVAHERLPKVKALAKKKREIQPPLPAACAPTIDVHELLEHKASFYLAELIAGHYPTVQPAERERYFRVLDEYVALALGRDRVPVSKLRDNPVFRAGELQRRYFTPSVRVRFVPDWVFDDFKLKNTGLFALHNAVIDLTVTQGGDSEQQSIRVSELLPGAEADVLEFNVSKDGGAVEVRGSISADEVKGSFEQRL
jgi:hypothetical protein